MHDHKLLVGQTISNAELTEKFKVGNMGGMRRSHATNSLVLVSDHTKGIYDDRWGNNICYYTGMGLVGEQVLASQNKTLFELDQNGVIAYLFEVHVAGKYRFHGQVKLAAKPFQEEQLDNKEEIRKVWIFPLETVQAVEPIPIPNDEIVALEKVRSKNLRKLSNEALTIQANKAPKKPSSFHSKTAGYYRNPYVAEYVRRRANGCCELCGNTGPFIVSGELPFLEVHHVIWLKYNGNDTSENTVALCPNCHRKMHMINDKQDIEKLVKVALQKL